MANITTLTDEILEQTTPVITATVRDEAGVAISGVNLTTLTLTLYSRNDPSYPIINTRDAQDVLNVNNVTVDANGLLTWALQSGDTTMYDESLDIETHRAVFEWTYNAGARNGKYMIDMPIRNLAKVT